MERHQRFAYLFRRYIDKTCTPQEREELFTMLLEEEHDDTLRRLITETWNEDLPELSADKDRADALLRRILSRREPETPASGFRIRKIPFYRCAAVAAGIALLSYLAISNHHHPSHPTTLNPPPALAANRPPADRCITLPDGSKVILHKTALLGDTSGFTQNARELTLTGEAYFDIRHDARPFIVHTGPIRTIVLGTAFNIDATNSRNIVITVMKGKVKVENGKGEYSILHRNEQLRVDSLHDRLQKIPVDAEALAWKKTYLIFNDVTMAEAINQIGRRYHLAVGFTNPAAGNCPVTASFIRGESLEEMVKVLARINNMEYSISRDRITIRGEGCNE